MPERRPPNFYDLPHIGDPYIYIEYAVFEDRTPVGLGFTNLGSARTLEGAQHIKDHMVSTVRPDGLPRTIRHRQVYCDPWQDTFPDETPQDAYLSDAPLAEAPPD